MRKATGTSLALCVAISILLSVWLVLILLGKGGMVHIILLTAIGVAAVEVIVIYRLKLEQ